MDNFIFKNNESFYALVDCDSGQLYQHKLYSSLSNARNALANIKQKEAPRKFDHIENLAPMDLTINLEDSYPNRRPPSEKYYKSHFKPIRKNYYYQNNFNKKYSVKIKDDKKYLRAMIARKKGLKKLLRNCHQGDDFQNAILSSQLDFVKEKIIEQCRYLDKLINSQK